MAAEQTDPFKWIKGGRLDYQLSTPTYLAMNSENGMLMTLKQAEIPRDDWDAESKKKAVSALESLRKEYELLSSLKHPGIIECYGAEQTADAFNVFLEYVPGGPVESLVVKYGAFEEGLAKAFAHNIVEGVAYLHSQSIIHNAISTNNIFVDNQGNCKILELSKAKRSTPGTLDGSSEGAYQVNDQADLWSLVEGSSAQPMPSNVELSPQAKDFLSQCFLSGPSDRPTAANLLNHQWLTPASS
ncbi:hypothetical protein M407DRAFT_22162 [Tulasnella calospora MUT 4182]|uniref:Protein kinase domain-containing protein n=1 Tax=Tulasnella calospora MUT 4182 TaxID=1051891 RepID=A0A0C3QLY5_9AGAM|nr:hypothetical protein M407DRAFT_22162 [Tulasnella calospora MUT 4182]